MRFLLASFSSLCHDSTLAHALRPDRHRADAAALPGHGRRLLMESELAQNGQTALLASAPRPDNPLLSETLQTLPSYVTRGLVYLVGLFLVVSLVFAGVSRIDVYVTAPADLIPEGKARLIQPDIDGTLSSDVTVKEGDAVAEGQVLAVVESREVTTLLVAVEAADADLRDARVEKQEIAPLKLEQLDKQIEILTAKIAHLKRVAQSVENKRKREEESFALAAKVYEVDKHKQEEAHKRLTLEVKSSNRTLELWRKELEVNRRLRAQDVVSEFQLLGVQRSYEEAGALVQKSESLLRDNQSERELLDRKFQATEIQHAKTVLDLLEQAELNTEAVQTALKEIDQRKGERRLVRREADRKLALATARYEQARHAANLGLHDLERETRTHIAQGESAATNRSVLTAPVAGRIGHVLVRNRGQSVRRGETLLTLLPSDADLVAQLHIANKDIGQVKKGQKVKFKFDAFPFAEHGVIQGELYNVVPDADSAEGPTSYRAYARLDQNYFRVKGQKVELLSGMTATGEIVTERKTLLELILRPFLELRDPDQAQP
jgi:HlyD family secretion protein